MATFSPPTNVMELLGARIINYAKSVLSYRPYTSDVLKKANTMDKGLHIHSSN
jgi:hypothetical protein